MLEAISLLEIIASEEFVMPTPPPKRLLTYIAEKCGATIEDNPLHLVSLVYKGSRIATAKTDFGLLIKLVRMMLSSLNNLPIPRQPLSTYCNNPEVMVLMAKYGHQLEELSIEELLDFQAVFNLGLSALHGNGIEHFKKFKKEYFQFDSLDLECNFSHRTDRIIGDLVGMDTKDASAFALGLANIIHDKLENN